jgi:chemotaxis protein MotB
MKKLSLPCGTLLLFALFLTSCVPSEKYKASESQIVQLQLDSATTHGLLEECYAQTNSLNDENASLQDKNDSVQLNLNKLSTSTELTITDQKVRVQELNKIVTLQKDVMTNLKSVLSQALVNYKPDELTVYTKNGKVYVSLEEKLLFKSGSDVVDPKGKEAIKSLVQILKTTKDVSVVVEGHTDNVPIHTAEFQDNWELSTARATSILRIMTADNGFNPYKITASGRASFYPVKSNKTAQGRAGNRRTEIILSPELKDVYSLLN